MANLTGMIREDIQGITQGLRERLEDAAEFGGEVWAKELQDAGRMVNEKLKPLADVAAMLRNSGNEQSKAQVGAARSADAWTGSTLKSMAAMAGFSLSVTGAYKALKDMASAASPNGLSGFSGAFTQLASVVGGQVLPAFTMLGAAIQTTADLLGRELGGPDVKAWASRAQGFADFAVDLKEGIVNSINLFKDPKKGISDSVSAFNRWDAGHFAMGDHQAKAAFKAIAEHQRTAATGGQGGDFGEKSVMEEYAENLGMMIRDMRRSMGKTGFSSAEEFYKGIQMSLAKTEREAKLFEQQEKNTRVLEQILSEIRNKQVMGA
jgi:hypothetical protein